MKLLLDTHVFIWAVADPLLLAEDVRSAIKDPDNQVLVSAVVPWEIAIKRGLGRLRFAGEVDEHTNANRFTELKVSFQHAAGVEMLPRLHSDPFDRLLVSQAIVEGATLVSRDSKVKRYDAEVMDA